MGAIGITVSLSHYRATVHYADCPLYTGYHTHENRTIPPSIKWKLCYKCKPTAEDIVTVAKLIEWGRTGGDAMNVPRQLISLDSDTEEISWRQNEYGRRLGRKKHD